MSYQIYFIAGNCEPSRGKAGPEVPPARPQAITLLVGPHDAPYQLFRILRQFLARADHLPQCFMHHRSHQDFQHHLQNHHHHHHPDLLHHPLDHSLLHSALPRVKQDNNFQLTSYRSNLNRPGLWHNTHSAESGHHTQHFLYHQDLNVLSPHKELIFELGFGNIKIRAT